MLSRRFCKFLAVFLGVGFVFYISIFALDRLIVNQPNHHVSLAIKDRFKQPEQWRPFTSRKGNFRVLIPGGYPQLSNQSIKVNGQSISLRSFQVNRKNPISFTVSYFDFAAQPIRPYTDIQAMSDQGVSTMKGKKLSSHDIKLGQVIGKEIYIETILKNGNLPASMRHRIYLKNRRLYQLVVITPSKNEFKGESDKFMESFEIIN